MAKSKAPKDTSPSQPVAAGEVAVETPTPTVGSLQSKTPRPPYFGEVWRRLQANNAGFNQMQFRRAMGNAGFPLWDRHNKLLYRQIEKKALEYMKDEDFVASVMTYYRTANSGDPIAMCRFAAIHAGFAAMTDVMTGLAKGTLNA